MPRPRVHFLPWDRPLLPQATAWLAGDWSGGTPLDLSDCLVIVPTRQAGRRLREALAALARSRGQAVFPPRVVPPEALLAEGAAAPDVATSPEALLAWIEVLRSIELDAFAEIFPLAPPARTFSWAFRLARELLRLQATLGENGLRLRDPSDGDRFGPFPESVRWRQLAALEARYDRALARRGRRDPQTARIAFADDPVPPDGIARIVVMGTPDPPSLLVRALERLPASVAVEVVVFAPPGAADRFDPWGRPRPEAWRRHEPALPRFEEHVHLCADPAGEAERLATIARSYPEPAQVLGVGVADAEILAPLHHALQRAGLAAYDPDGRARRGEPLHRLLTLCMDLAREASFATVAVLARCPDVLAWLQTEAGGGLSPASLLASLDRLHARHLPTTLEAARRHASGDVARALEAIAGLRDELTAAPFPENVRRALARVFAGRSFDLANEAEARFADSLAAWNDIAARFAAAATHFPDTGRDDLFALALEIFGESLYFTDKPPGALELQGWLELLWEDAPHLVVAGLNDGRVPDAVVGDPFLPEGLREQLGLRTNAARLARDAYLLGAIAACRAKHGRLDLALAKATSAGEPLRPSRLLLACDDAALPERVRFLFRVVPATQADTPWNRAFQLVPPPPAAPLTHLPVTSFANYLRCPFRFYLRHVLKLRPVDPRKAELDDLDFGHFCHRALEILGTDPALRDCTDEDFVRERLLTAFDDIARTTFGRDVPVPLLVQLESARQRLARVAAVHVRERAAGWVIERVESPFELSVGGLVVRGMIDRIERNELTGEWRVLDYKTRDRATEPKSHHVRELRNRADDESVPAFARFTIDDRTYAWRDLQLPLYLHALRSEFGERVQCGYFQMPRAVTETAVVPWHDYGPEWQEAAWRCAEGVVAAVRAGRFWPPREEKPTFDDFASLFHQGAAESIAWPPAPAAAPAEVMP